MEEKSANNKALLTLAVKYLVGAAAITCESYAAFFACLHFGWSSGFFWVLGLLITLINAFVLKLRPFVDRSKYDGVSTERIVHSLGNFLVAALWLLVITSGSRILTGAAGIVSESTYETITRMPFVESYMHENDMLDSYYESVIRMNRSPEDVAWAQERLAD